MVLYPSIIGCLFVWLWLQQAGNILKYVFNIVPQFS
jgi:hypothetical protein